MASSSALCPVAASSLRPTGPLKKTDPPSSPAQKPPAASASVLWPEDACHVAVSPPQVPRWPFHACSPWILSVPSRHQVLPSKTAHPPQVLHIPAVTLLMHSIAPPYAVYAVTLCEISAHLPLQKEDKDACLLLGGRCYLPCRVIRRGSALSHLHFVCR